MEYVVSEKTGKTKLHARKVSLLGNVSMNFLRQIIVDNLLKAIDEKINIKMLTTFHA